MISTKANAEMSLFLGSGLGKFVGLRGLHSGTTWKYGHLVRLCQRWLAKSHQTSSRDAGISRGSYKTAGLWAVRRLIIHVVAVDLPRQRCSRTQLALCKKS